MKTHYAEPSVPTLTTTTDPEHTCPWGKTHLSPARFSRREWGQSWRCPRPVGGTPVTNDDQPETAKAGDNLLMGLLKSLSKLLHPRLAEFVSQPRKHDTNPREIH